MKYTTIYCTSVRHQIAGFEFNNLPFPRLMYLFMFETNCTQTGQHPHLEFQLECCGGAVGRGQHLLQTEQRVVVGVAQHAPLPLRRQLQFPGQRRTAGLACTVQRGNFSSLYHDVKVISVYAVCGKMHVHILITVCINTPRCQRARSLILEYPLCKTK